MCVRKGVVFFCARSRRVRSSKGALSGGSTDIGFGNCWADETPSNLGLILFANISSGCEKEDGTEIKRACLTNAGEEEDSVGELLFCFLFIYFLSRVFVSCLTETQHRFGLTKSLSPFFNMKVGPGDLALSRFLHSALMGEDGKKKKKKKGDPLLAPEAC